MKFSPNSNYLATAGYQNIIYVWQIFYKSTPNVRHSIIDEVPFRVYIGHESEILDFSWSKKSFIISTSQDSVRLWHVDREPCICTFVHQNPVTSVCFLPSDECYFLTGMLRIWKIPEGRVVQKVKAPYPITMAAFSSNDRYCIVGFSNGICYIYSSTELTYITQLNCRNKKGQYKLGTSVTGFDFIKDKSRELNIIITTKDNSVRLYSLDDFSYKQKYKGATTFNSNVRAQTNSQHSHIMCPSTSGDLYIWRISNDLQDKSIFTSSDNIKNRSVEYFTCTSKDDYPTAAVFGPSKLLFDYYGFIPDYSPNFPMYGFILIVGTKKGYINVFCSSKPISNTNS